MTLQQTSAFAQFPKPTPLTPAEKTQVTNAIKANTSTTTSVTKLEPTDPVVAAYKKVQQVQESCVGLLRRDAVARSEPYETMFRKTFAQPWSTKLIPPTELESRIHQVQMLPNYSSRIQSLASRASNIFQAHTAFNWKMNKWIWQDGDLPNDVQDLPTVKQVNYLWQVGWEKPTQINSNTLMQDQLTVVNTFVGQINRACSDSHKVYKEIKDTLSDQANWNPMVNKRIKALLGAQSTVNSGTKSGLENRSKQVAWLGSTQGTIYASLMGQTPLGAMLQNPTDVHAAVGNFSIDRCVEQGEQLKTLTLPHFQKLLPNSLKQLDQLYEKVLREDIEYQSEGVAVDHLMHYYETAPHTLFQAFQDQPSTNDALMLCGIASGRKDSAIAVEDFVSAFTAVTMVFAGVGIILKGVWAGIAIAMSLNGYAIVNQLININYSYQMLHALEASVAAGQINAIQAQATRDHIHQALPFSITSLGLASIGMAASTVGAFQFAKFSKLQARAKAFELELQEKNKIINQPRSYPRSGSTSEKFVEAYGQMTSHELQSLVAGYPVVETVADLNSGRGGYGPLLSSTYIFPRSPVPYTPAPTAPGRSDKSSAPGRSSSNVGAATLTKPAVATNQILNSAPTTLKSTSVYNQLLPQNALSPLRIQQTIVANQDPVLKATTLPKMIFANHPPLGDDVDSSEELKKFIKKLNEPSPSTEKLLQEALLGHTSILHKTVLERARELCDSKGSAITRHICGQIREKLEQIAKAVKKDAPFNPTSAVLSFSTYAVSYGETEDKEFVVVYEHIARTSDVNHVFKTIEIRDANGKVTERAIVNAPMGLNIRLDPTNKYEVSQDQIYVFESSNFSQTHVKYIQVTFSNGVPMIEYIPIDNNPNATRLIYGNNNNVHSNLGIYQNKLVRASMGTKKNPYSFLVQDDGTILGIYHFDPAGLHLANVLHHELIKRVVVTPQNKELGTHLFKLSNVVVSKLGDGYLIIPENYIPIFIDHMGRTGLGRLHSNQKDLVQFDMPAYSYSDPNNKKEVITVPSQTREFPIEEIEYLYRFNFTRTYPGLWYSNPVEVDLTHSNNFPDLNQLAEHGILRGNQILEEVSFAKKLDLFLALNQIDFASNTDDDVLGHFLPQELSGVVSTQEFIDAHEAGIYYGAQVRQFNTIPSIQNYLSAASNGDTGFVFGSSATSRNVHIVNFKVIDGKCWFFDGRTGLVTKFLSNIFPALEPHQLQFINTTYYHKLNDKTGQIRTTLDQIRQNKTIEKKIFVSYRYSKSLTDQAEKRAEVIDIDINNRRMLIISTVTNKPEWIKTDVQGFAIDQLKVQPGQPVTALKNTGYIPQVLFQNLYLNHQLTRGLVFSFMQNSVPSRPELAEKFTIESQHGNTVVAKDQKNVLFAMSENDLAHSFLSTQIPKDFAPFLKNLILEDYIAKIAKGLATSTYSESFVSEITIDYKYPGLTEYNETILDGKARVLMIDNQKKRILVQYTIRLSDRKTRSALAWLNIDASKLEISNVTTSMVTKYKYKTEPRDDLQKRFREDLEAGTIPIGTTILIPGSGSQNPIPNFSFSFLIRAGNTVLVVRVPRLPRLNSGSEWSPRQLSPDEIERATYLPRL